MWSTCKRFLYLRAMSTAFCVALTAASTGLALTWLEKGPLFAYLENLFNLDFNKAVKHFYKNYKNEHFSKNTKEALIEMIFQLGIKKQKKIYKNEQVYQKKTFFYGGIRNDG